LKVQSPSQVAGISSRWRDDEDADTGRFAVVFAFEPHQPPPTLMWVGFGQDPRSYPSVNVRCLAWLDRFPSPGPAGQR
jgi:hypothetical protein